MADEERPFGDGEDDPEPKKKDGRGDPNFGQRMKDARAAAKARREAGGGASAPKPSTAKARSSKPSPASPTSSPAQVAGEVKDGLDKLALMLTIPAPIPAVYVADTSAELAGIVGRMAERNPKLLAALEGSSNLMDYIALGSWGLGLVVATGVQVGRINADAPISKVTGIEKIVSDLESAGVLSVVHPGAPQAVPDDDGVADGDGLGAAFDPAQAFTPPEPIIADPVEV